MHRSIVIAILLVPFSINIAHADSWIDYSTGSPRQCYTTSQGDIFCRPFRDRDWPSMSDERQQDGRERYDAGERPRYRRLSPEDYDQD